MVGIDIGGTYSKAGLVQNDKIIYKTKIPTQINGSEKAFFGTVFSLIDDILQNNKLGTEQIKGVGIGVAGMVLADKGILLSASNLKLDKTDIVRGVRSRYNIPVAIANDVSCYALAEACINKQDNLVYIAIGTGLNIGVINRGKLLGGADGASLEYGQTALWDATVETYLSGPGYKKFGQEKMLKALSVVLVNLANTYRPQKIILGGGVSGSITPAILKQLRKQFKDSNYGYINAPEVALEISSLGYDGSVLGAASLLH